MNQAAAFTPKTPDIPPPFDHQRESVEFYAGIPHVFNMSDPGCVSADTEYLTPTGWKRIDRYVPGDQVAQFHPDTKNIEFVEPLEYVKRPCETMISIAPSRGTSQRLSHEHRVLLYSKDHPDEWKVVSAKEFADEFTSLTRPTQFRFAFACTFNTPVDRKGVPLTDAQLRLQVAVIADGHLDTASTARVTLRLKKPRKIQRLRHLLQAAKVDFKHRHCNSAPGFEVFSFYAPTADKHFTADFWWDATAHQLSVIADEARHWDRSIDRRNKNGSVRLVSYTRADAEFLQYAFAASGWTTTRSDHARARRGTIKTAYELRAYHNGGLVGPGRKRAVNETPNPEGYKYCFEVPSSFLLLRHNGYIFATGNTGKTRAWLDWFAGHRDSGGGAGLVLCPKSIMTAAWENDARKYTPHLRVSVATAKRRRDALKPGADLYVLNHDAVQALIKDPKLLPAGVDCFNIDESTAFKHATSQRSKAAFKLLKPFEHRVVMSGTPAPQGVLDLWHQALIVDLGERLGTSYFKFRQTVCDPIQVGPHQNHVKWEEKPGALDAVIDLISDITLRFKLEDCIDMPDRVEYFVDFPLSPKHRQQYTELKGQALLMLKNGAYIDAIHAASMRIRLLQLLSGACYDSQKVSQSITTDRYNLVIDLVEQREASLVAFMFTHQRDALIDEAKRRGLRYGLIDGSVPGNERSAVVDRFRAGHLDVIFAHPASAGHGLTLTRANAVIWASPTDNAEHWTQFNARIYRAGQTKRTEIIKVIARDTIEEKAFDNLTRKLTNQEALLEMLT